MKPPMDTLQVLAQVLLLFNCVESHGLFSADHLASLREVVDGYNALTERATSDSQVTYDDLMTFTNLLARQVMLQQSAAEERVRSDGGSGIKQVRSTRTGTKPYYSTAYSGISFAAIHDHSNNSRVVGMGELDAMLNGVEFKTRHNDYKLFMPHMTSAEYHAVEEVPYPDVPPSVTNKPTVPEQIAEMQEYFKAFATEDPTHRPYEDYFKPVLCYMEGHWTTLDGDSIEEPFESDLHQLDAKTWTELQDKVRFAGYSGRKDPNENYAFLPTSIYQQDRTIKQAQWNYRILCHPLSHHLAPSRLVLVDDLFSRMGQNNTVDLHRMSHAARFKVNVIDSDKPQDKVKNFDQLDEIMLEVPGLDNYQADLMDTSHGGIALHYSTGEVLNTARYHRWFRTSYNDAMGSPRQHKMYSDPNMFVAMTTQPKVPSVTMNWCNEDNICEDITQKFTYAVPMEIIYLTPLYNWNPYNIVHKGEDEIESVTTNGRNGGLDTTTAFDGTNDQLFFRTPYDFYDTTDVNGNPTPGKTGVLDASGAVQYTVASGTRILLPSIPGVGVVRTRYPIMPTHQDNSAVWKGVDALKSIVLNPQSMGKYFREKFPHDVSTGEIPEPPLDFTAWYMTQEADPAFDNHVHYVPLSVEDLLFLSEGGGNQLTVETTESWGHTHELVITDRDNGHFDILTCDGYIKCFDLHARNIVPGQP